MKIPQMISTEIDFGPVISFTGFPVIISKVQTNMTPSTPNKTNIMPFAFISYLLINKKTTPLSSGDCLQLLDDFGPILCGSSLVQGQTPWFLCRHPNLHPPRHIGVSGAPLLRRDGLVPRLLRGVSPFVRGQTLLFLACERTIYQPTPLNHQKDAQGQGDD